MKSAVAIVAVRDAATQFYGYLRPTVFSIDEKAASLAAWSYVEGWERAFERVFEAALGSWTDAMRTVQRRNAPTYVEIRNWLHGDCEFEYLTACRVALRVTNRQLVMVQS